jgi:hypothetical protein
LDEYIKNRVKDEYGCLENYYKIKSTQLKSNCKRDLLFTRSLNNIAENYQLDDPEANLTEENASLLIHSRTFLN